MVFDIKSCVVTVRPTVARHPLVPPVLLRVPWFDPFDLDPESQPPHGQLAQPVQGMRGGKRNAVVGPNQLRKAKFLEGALEDREGELLLGASVTIRATAREVT